MTVDLVGRLLGEIAKTTKRVVFIGDVMVDRWIHGRISNNCQDGCPKFVQETVVEVPGGAANAERSLSHWGVNTSLYGWASNECPIKTRYVHEDLIVFRVDDDTAPHSTGYRWAYELALEMVGSAGAVLLSDYDKGFLSPEFILAVVGMCKRAGIPCVADCKRAPEVYEGCILKGNAEWCERTKMNLLTSNMVITFGDGVPTVSGRSIEPSDLPPVKLANHVGAGDCFAAHLALGLAYGFSLKESAALAHSAGRVYVQRPHNRPPLPAEVQADLFSAT